MRFGENLVNITDMATLLNTPRTMAYLNASIQIMTPHYGTVSVKLEYFNVGDSNYLDSERKNETRLTFADEEQTKYEYAVVTGLNLINASLHLKGKSVV